MNLELLINKGNYFDNHNDYQNNTSSHEITNTASNNNQNQVNDLILAQTMPNTKFFSPIITENSDNPVPTHSTPMIAHSHQPLYHKTKETIAPDIMPSNIA